MWKLPGFGSSVSWPPVFTAVRHRRSVFRCGLALLLAALAGVLVASGALGADDAQPRFVVAPPASWVVPLVPERRKNVVTNQIEGGESFLLKDEQVNVGSSEFYNHSVREILNENGVQNGAQINVRFDPSYQQLTFHHIRLVRDGVVLDRLVPDKIKMLQQERDLERHIYNGSLSAVLFLEDVRVGDWIDWAYTVRGVNPILGGRFADDFSVQWSLPLQHRRFRLLWPAGRTLFIRNHGTRVQPTIRALGNGQEYVWELHDIAPVSPEDDVPGWYDDYGWVQLSEFHDWASVAKWAAELYPPAPLSPELARKVEEWRRASTQPEVRLTTALQFMQDEVRYMGIEFGPNSHRPTAPATVFARRFGDCKDKAYLFCTVLAELGIEATPVLVNTIYRATIDDWLPSPYAFNHVVARVRLEGREVWVDPTRSQQRGPLAARFFPDYGRCLPVRADTTSLAGVPPPSTGLPKTTVHETFTVRGPKEPAEFRIVTIAEGLDADRLRDYLANTSREEVGKSYLNFYARQYPKVQVARPLEVLDQTASNVVQTTEHYRIDEFWELTKNKRHYAGDFRPQTLSQFLEKPSTKLRSMPLALSVPQRQIVRTEVRLPEEWAIKDSGTTLTNPAATLVTRRTCRNQLLVMEYDYQSFTNAVSVASVPEYLKMLDRMHDELGYQLTWENPDAPKPVSQPNWSIMLLAGFYGVLLLIGAAFLYRWRPLVPPPLPDAEMMFSTKPGPEGLRGWLMLVALGMFITPFSVARYIIEAWPAYTLTRWRDLTMPGGESYHALWAPTLIFELLANLTIVVLALLLLGLFFEKRHTFPRLFIIYIAFGAVVAGLDYCACQLIPALADQSSTKETMRNLIRSIASCMIWIPYMLVSKRVRATFVK